MRPCRCDGARGQPDAFHRGLVVGEMPRHAMSGEEGRRGCTPRRPAVVGARLRRASHHQAIRTGRLSTAAEAAIAIGPSRPATRGHSVLLKRGKHPRRQTALRATISPVGTIWSQNSHPSRVRLSTTELLASLCWRVALSRAKRSPHSPGPHPIAAPSERIECACTRFASIWFDANSPAKGSKYCGRPLERSRRSGPGSNVRAGTAPVRSACAGASGPSRRRSSSVPPAGGTHAERRPRRGAVPPRRFVR